MLILAISGSLRTASSSSALIAAVALLAPPGVEVEVYQGLGGLPHFNPDFADVNVPDSVSDWRARLERCDAVLICSPEYAHGVPGTMKNALDWVVGSGELIDKPVAVVNVSPSSTYAQASLSGTLRVMSAQVVAPASILISMAGRTLDGAGIAADPALASQVLSAITALASSVRGQTGV